MRDLIELNVYSMEEFERAKTVLVRTAEVCVKEEERIAELKNAMDDLVRNKAEYKNDRLVERVSNRLSVAVNFLTKACSAFSSVADSVNRNRAALEQRRADATANLNLNKVSRPAPQIIPPANHAEKLDKTEEVAVVKKKAGRPKSKK